jgi:catechol 2,3-dioxygenase-like lactoylglutathione lyase family enzyme
MDHLEHFAVSANSVDEADKFFVTLLELEKTRDFEVNAELIDQFFGVNSDQRLLRYEDDNIAAEVFINKEKKKAENLFSHVCLVIDNRDELIQKAKELGYKVIKVPRNNSDSYYLFLHDAFGNIYEIK